MPTTCSVTFRALNGVMLVRGLTEESANTAVRDWESCGARRLSEHEADALEAAKNDDERNGEPLVDVIQRGSVSEEDDRAFFELLVSNATNLAIRSRRGQNVLFHGAALAHTELGTAIALVAESGTGKTTATRHLGREFAYLTDETVSISLEPGADYAVERFAKPLSILDGGKRPKVQHAPGALGLVPAQAAPGARLVAVALLDRIRGEADALGLTDGDGGASTAPPRADSGAAPGASRLTMIEALAELTGQTSSLASLPRGLVAFATLLDACGGGVRLRYRDCDELDPLVRGLLERGTIPAEDAPGRAARDGDAPEWSPIDLDEAALNDLDAQPAGPGRWWRRARIADGIEIGHDLALLTNADITVISGVAPTLWWAADGWRELDDFVRVAVGALGEHPEAESIVDSALEQLHEEGVLEYRVVLEESESGSVECGASERDAS